LGYIVHCINAALHQQTEVQNMMNKIEQLADNLKVESRLLADRAVAGLRTAGLETAGLLTKSKGPVHAIADTGLRINNLSHKSIEKLLKQQVAALEDIIDGSARRLEMAARAKSVKTLVEGQVSTLPQSRDHALKNARKTVAIVRDTGDAFGDLFKGVVADASGAARPAGRKSAGRPAGRKKAAGRKPAAKKRAVSKSPAKKSTAKRAQAA
jgi:phasin family protein